MKGNLLLLIGFIASMFAGSLHAQTCTVDQIYMGTDTRQSIVGSDTTQPEGQSFKAGMTGAIYSVYLDISASNPGCSISNMNVRVDILQGDTVAGTKLASQVYTRPVTFSRMVDTFNFTSPAIVTAGQMYTILFSLEPGQSCGSAEPQLIWYFEFPTNFWTNTGGKQYQNGVVTSLGNTQYFATCVGTPAGISGVQEDAGTVSAYPNPFTDNLTVKSKSALQNIKVTNLLGEVVYEEKTRGTRKQVDLSGLDSGVYLVRVKTLEGTSTLKLLKQ